MGCAVCLWRLSVGPDHHLTIVQQPEFVMRNDDKSQQLQSFNLFVVVDNISQAIEQGIFLQFAFSNLYGIDHAKAKAGMGINGNLQPYCFLTNSWRLTPTVR